MAYFDKDSEREHLKYFLSARKYATGEELVLVSDCESPDFICRRPNGQLVGIEHTRIEYNPERTEILEACRVPHGELDNFVVLYAAARATAPKDSSPSNDFSGAGFIEVWLSDHSSIEGYGEVTAIGLYPESIWGVQGQDYLWGVPYK
jgi:hypothetical protein